MARRYDSEELRRAVTREVFRSAGFLVPCPNCGHEDLRKHSVCDVPDTKTFVVGCPACNYVQIKAPTPRGVLAPRWGL